MAAKNFKNGNIHVRFEREEVEYLKNRIGDDIMILGSELQNVDAVLVGDEFCISNYEMGAMIYSFYSDLVYIINFNDVDNILRKGKTLILYGREPDEDDREDIKREYGETM